MPDIPGSAMPYGTGGNILDYQGQSDGATWIKLEATIAELKAERDFLREMLRLALSVAHKEETPHVEDTTYARLSGKRDRIGDESKAEEYQA